jgi:hypothetical protein
MLDVSGISGPFGDASETSMVKNQATVAGGPKFNDDTYLSEIDSQEGSEDSQNSSAEKRKKETSDDDIIYTEELF